MPEQFILLRAATFDLPDFYETGLKKLEQGDNKGAIADFDQAMENARQNVAHLHAAHHAQINLKQYGFAKDDIEHAYTMEQGNPDYYLQLSYLYLQTKEWKFAANAAKLTLDRDPKRVGAFLNRAYAWRALGQTQDAWTIIKKRLNFRPKRPSCMRCAVICFSIYKNGRKACAIYGNILASPNPTLIQRPRISIYG